MTKITLLIELDYDAEIMHGDDAEAREWFFDILKNDRLILHSNEIGDEIGDVTVLEINAPNHAMQLTRPSAPENPDEFHPRG